MPTDKKPKSTPKTRAKSSAGRKPQTPPRPRGTRAQQHASLSPRRLEIPPPSELAKRIFSPDCTSLETAKECALEQTDPRAVWESLSNAGVIPMSWIEDPSRHFAVTSHCLRCNVRSAGFPHEAGCPNALWPDDIAVAVALGSYAQTAQQAELLVQELISRLDPWEGGLSPKRVLWRVCDAPQTVYVSRRPGLEVLASYRGAKRTEADGSYSNATSYLFNKRKWSQSSAPYALGVDCFRALNYPFRDNETRLNPFEPLIEIWKLGLIPESLDLDAFVMLAPRNPTP